MAFFGVLLAWGGKGKRRLKEEKGGRLEGEWSESQ